MAEKSKDPSYKSIMRRGEGDVTRIIDWVSEGEIIRRIEEEGIRALIITEERGVVKVNGENPDYLFIVDPLDGSLNFVLDVPFYAISIAVAKYRERLTLSDIDAGIIYHIASGTSYYAEKGMGALINGKPPSFELSYLDKPVASIYIEPTTDTKAIELLATLYRGLGGFKIRSFGAASLEVAMAALGKLLFFLDIRNRLRLYDIAAAYVLARELKAHILTSNNVEIANVPISEQPKVSLLVTRSSDVVKALSGLFK